MSLGVRAAQVNAETLGRLQTMICVRQVLSLGVRARLVQLDRDVSARAATLLS
jgi:hypothetical protein